MSLDKSHVYTKPENVPDHVKEAFEAANEQIRATYDALVEKGAMVKEMPVGRTLWVHISEVRANDYNPNRVAEKEMGLLHTSISEDGYTQPTVAIQDPETGMYVIVDGFHRYSTMRLYEDIAARTYGYLPVVVLDKPISDRMASTVRHNRARGKHSITGMSSIVFGMLQEGESDVTILSKLGLEPQELARLKHTTGYSKLYGDVKQYSDVYMTQTQMFEKAKYKKEHPDEVIEKF